jgi:hypothetical protein
MPPKTPRNVSGSDLIKLLSKYGYEVTRQKAVILECQEHLMKVLITSRFQITIL